MKLNKLLTLTDKNLYKEIKGALPVPFIAKKDYIVTRQHKKPSPLICVHLDTVSDKPPKLLERKENIVTAPGAHCLGADDRAGVYIALQMMKLGTKTPFEYGFFMGEEKGAIGSSEYGLIYPEHTAFIGLDRCSRDGKQNTATYGYDNTDLINCFPYPESRGSVSDCSVLSSYTDMACVNVSVGFQNEHSAQESLNLNLMIETLNVMLNIDIPDKTYETTWKPNYSKYDDYLNAYYENLSPVCCDRCGQHNPLFHMDGEMICDECISYETSDLPKSHFEKDDFSNFWKN